jgi:hypothetical protein
MAKPLFADASVGICIYVYKQGDIRRFQGQCQTYQIGKFESDIPTESMTWERHPEATQHVKSPAEAGLGCDRFPGAAPPESGALDRMASHHSGLAPAAVCTCRRNRRYPDDRPEFHTLKARYQPFSAAQA